MRINCLCLAKNEDDVIGDVLADASRWADVIFVADNRSTDNTASVIRRMAGRFDNIVDIGPALEDFSDDLRAKLYRRVAHLSRRGDWWCRLDADEFYIDDPRAFLGALPAQIDTVWSSHFQFYFTDVDLRRYTDDPQAFLSTPVRQRLLYYRNDSSEIRFVKHTFPFLWLKQWPRYRCAASTRRIRLAHYQYRSPEQILRRLETRRKLARETGTTLFPHEQRNALLTDQRWRHASSRVELLPDQDAPRFEERVASHEGLDLLQGGNFLDRPDQLPPVTDVWPERVPFFLWKPYRILLATLYPRRLVGRITRRLERAISRFSGPSIPK